MGSALGGDKELDPLELGFEVAASGHSLHAVWRLRTFVLQPIFLFYFIHLSGYHNLSS